MTRFLQVLFALLVIVVLATAGLSYWVSRSLNAPHEHTKANEFVTIEKGSSPKQIIEKLSDEGILSSYLATMLYVRTIGDASKLQAGEYQFPSPITALQVLKELEKGESQTTKLTIPEGFTRFDIA